MPSFSLQTRVTSNKYLVHCTSKFCCFSWVVVLLLKKDMNFLVIRQVFRNCTNLWPKMGLIINSVPHTKLTLGNGWINVGKLSLQKVLVFSQAKQSFGAEENERRFYFSTMCPMNAPVHEIQYGFTICAWGFVNHGCILLHFALIMQTSPVSVQVKTLIFLEVSPTQHQLC